MTYILSMKHKEEPDGWILTNMQVVCHFRGREYNFYGRWLGSKYSNSLDYICLGCVYDVKSSCFSWLYLEHLAFLQLGGFKESRSYGRREEQTVGRRKARLSMAPLYSEFSMLNITHWTYFFNPQENNTGTSSFLQQKEFIFPGSIGRFAQYTVVWIYPWNELLCIMNMHNEI